jgi:hypothetical protein
MRWCFYKRRPVALSPWGYRQFHNTTTVSYKVSGRVKHYINAFGEEVIVDNSDKAVAIASEKTAPL